MSTNQQRSILEWATLKLPPINLWNLPRMLTPAERDERLKQIAEIDLLEILDISSEDIVERFADKIEEREFYYLEDLEDEEKEE